MYFSYYFISGLSQFNRVMEHALRIPPESVQTKILKYDPLPGFVAFCPKRKNSFSTGKGLFIYQDVRYTPCKSDRKVEKHLEYKKTWCLETIPATSGTGTAQSPSTAITAIARSLYRGTETG